MRAVAQFHKQVSASLLRLFFRTIFFLTRQLPCCIEFRNETAQWNIFFRGVAQFPKQVSAFLLWPFCFNLIFFDETVALLHRIGKSDCFKKYLFESCCAVFKAGLSFSAKAFFYGPYFFLTKQLPCCIELGNKTAS